MVVTWTRQKRWNTLDSRSLVVGHSLNARSWVVYDTQGKRIYQLFWAEIFMLKKRSNVLPIHYSLPRSLLGRNAIVFRSLNTRFALRLCCVFVAFKERSVMTSLRRVRFTNVFAKHNAIATRTNVEHWTHNARSERVERSIKVIWKNLLVLFLIDRQTCW